MQDMTRRILGYGIQDIRIQIQDEGCGAQDMRIQAGNDRMRNTENEDTGWKS